MCRNGFQYDYYLLLINCDLGHLRFWTFCWPLAPLLHVEVLQQKYTKRIFETIIWGNLRISNPDKSVNACSHFLYFEI